MKVPQPFNMFVRLEERLKRICGAEVHFIHTLPVAQKQQTVFKLCLQLSTYVQHC